MDTTNILLDILLFVKDIKSNNNIFDRNREYMTRNRWLNKQRLPSPRYGLRYWCSRRNGQGTRTQVLFGEVQIVKHLSTRSPNQIELICKPSSVHTEWIFMNNLSEFPHKNASNVDLANEDQLCQAACSLLWQQRHGTTLLQQRVTLPPLLCPRKNLFCNNESRSRRNFLSSVTTSCDNFGFLSQHHFFWIPASGYKVWVLGAKLNFPIVIVNTPTRPGSQPVLGFLASRLPGKKDVWVLVNESLNVSLRVILESGGVIVFAFNVSLLLT